MNILVTGGAGYIGSIVAEEPIRPGERGTIKGDLADTEALMDTRVKAQRGRSPRWG